MEGFNSSFINKEQLPLIIQSSQLNLSKENFFYLLSSQKSLIKQQLSKYGGILFRGFPLQTANDFAAAIRHLGLGDFVDYIGGDSPRNKINEGVYTSTEAPPSVKIPLHNELSFVKYYPKNIYFFCEIPPQAKGETIIADARKVLEAIDPDVKQRFIDKGLRYISCYYYKSRIMDWLNKIQPSHKTWIQVFETDSKQEVEYKCQKHEFEYQWTKNDWLQISQVRPAVMAHPETGEKVWFNQAHLYDFNPKLLGTWRYVGARLFYCRNHTKLHQIFYADHTSIPRTDLYHVLDVLDAQTIAFPWQKGDLLVLDNVLAMHGRATFQGKRRILTAMTS
jgi:alpha-ketoglutarate-dependent taurine dioxygenase